MAAAKKEHMKPKPRWFHVATAVNRDGDVLVYAIDDRGKLFRLYTSEYYEPRWSELPPPPAEVP